MHPLEAELLVERDRVLVVVHDRQVHEGRAPRLEQLRQLAHQRLAHAGLGRLRVDREAPERGALLGVVVGARVVHTRHRADDGAADVVLGDEVDDRARIPARPEEFRRHRHHAARGVDAVHGVGVRAGNRAGARRSRDRAARSSRNARGRAGRCATGRGRSPAARRRARRADRARRRRCRAGPGAPPRIASVSSRMSSKVCAEEEPPPAAVDQRRWGARARRRDRRSGWRRRWRSRSVMICPPVRVHGCCGRRARLRGSDAVALQPGFEQRHLPQLGSPQGGVIAERGSSNRPCR